MPQRRLTGVGSSIGEAIAGAVAGDPAAIASVVAHFSPELINSARRGGGRDPEQMVHRVLTGCLGDLAEAGRTTEFGFRIRLLTALSEELNADDDTSEGEKSDFMAQLAAQTMEFSSVADLASMTQEIVLPTVNDAPTPVPARDPDPDPNPNPDLNPKSGPSQADSPLSPISPVPKVVRTDPEPESSSLADEVLRGTRRRHRVRTVTRWLLRTVLILLLAALVIVVVVVGAVLLGVDVGIADRIVNLV